MHSRTNSLGQKVNILSKCSTPRPKHKLVFSTYTAMKYDNSQQKDARIEMKCCPYVVKPDYIKVKSNSVLNYPALKCRKPLFPKTDQTSNLKYSSAKKSSMKQWKLDLQIDVKFQKKSNNFKNGLKEEGLNWKTVKKPVVMSGGNTARVGKGMQIEDIITSGVYYQCKAKLQTPKSKLITLRRY